MLPFAQPIYMPKDPRYEGWGDTLVGIGKAFAAAGKEKKNKAMSKIALMIEYGGIATGQEVAAWSKESGLPLKQLSSIFEYKKGEEGEEDVYIIYGSGARELTATKQKLQAQEDFNQKNFKNSLARETRLKEMELELKEQLETAKLMGRKEVARIGLEPRKLTPEKSELFTQQARLAEAQAGWFEEGKPTEAGKRDLAFGKLEELGLLTKIQHGKAGTTKEIKPLTVGSKEYNIAKETLDASGIKYTEVPAGKDLFRRNKVKLIPTPTKTKEKKSTKKTYTKEELLSDADFNEKTNTVILKDGRKLKLDKDGNITINGGKFKIK